MDKSIGFKTVWGIWYSFPNLQHYCTYIYMNHQICCLHPEISQDGKSEWSRNSEPFQLLESPFDFPPPLPFHQLGFSWNKEDFPSKTLPFRSPSNSCFWSRANLTFYPHPKNRFRHHHRFSGWCFRPDQKNMIVKMGSSSSIFGVKIKSMSCHHPDYINHIVYWLIKKGILF